MTFFASRSPLLPTAVGISLFLLATAGSAAEGAGTVAGPLTVAEKSGFRATSRSGEVIQFIDDVSRHASHLQRFEFGRTANGRSLVCAAVAQPAVREPAQLVGDPRLVVLLLGNIHAGECAGKEALLMLLRELSQHPEHEWLKHLVLLFVPNYNADGNDNVGLDNRPGQVGPADGMGRRENAQGLDLNRDYIKLDSPECRALVGLIDQWDPHLFIDMHTTNGSRIRYALTYDVPHNPAAPAGIRSFLRHEMMPAITGELENQGIATFFYGNFNRDHTRWTTFGDSPRFGTEYMGLRGRLSILSEAYAYISYEERIVASREFVRQCLDFAILRADAIRHMLDEIRHQAADPITRSTEDHRVSIRSRVTPLKDRVSVRGYDISEPPGDRDAEPTHFLDDRPRDYEVEFYTQYEPTLTVRRPSAYLIPADQKEVLERLRYHAIKFEPLTADATRNVEYYVVTSVKRSAHPYQGRHLLQVEAETRTHMRLIPQGTMVVRTDQPLSNLIVYLLEPMSNDGLATWNLFEPEPAAGSEFPVLRVVND